MVDSVIPAVPHTRSPTRWILGGQASLSKPNQQERRGFPALPTVPQWPHSLSPLSHPPWVSPFNSTRAKPTTLTRTSWLSSGHSGTDLVGRERIQVTRTQTLVISQ